MVTWYKPLIKVTAQAQNLYFDFLIDPSFQGGNTFFALIFKNATDRYRI